MKRHRWWLSIVCGGMVLWGAACGDAKDEPSRPSPVPTTALPSPTVILAAPTQTPGGPTLTPSPTIPPTITATNSPPPPPPTGTATPTETPGPYEHVVQAGEDCIGILYQYGHLDPQAVNALEQLNDISCRALPAGGTILVPRPTPTATAIGADLTATVVATSAPPMVTLNAPVAFAVQPYTVQEGDTLMSIALSNDTSMRQICELNQDVGPNGLNCRGCKWENANCCCPSNVAPILVPGQQINVPAPTPTPTLTATFTGSETPTATPTHPAPQPILPAEGAALRGPVRLSWLTVGPLAEDEYYLVTVRDETTGTVFSGQTRQLSLDLPQDYLPPDGQARTFVWQVSVVRLGSDGLLYPTGSAVAERRFEWQGWQ